MSDNTILGTKPFSDYMSVAEAASKIMKLDEHKGTKPHKHPHEPGEEEVETEESELSEAVHDKKTTFTMAPFEDLRSVADAALKIMTRQPQEVKEEEKEEVTKENQPQQLTEQIV